MKMLALSIVMIFATGFATAEETISDKTKATANDISRSGKKMVHRTKEALCGKLTGDNKVQCLAKEAKNRMIEGKDSVVDKASEIKNSVQDDKK